MRILFLSHYFPPEVNAPACRISEHARVWVKEGHKVDVLTCVPNHPRGKVYDGYRNRLLQREVIDGVTVNRMLTLPAKNSGFLGRAAAFFFYLPMATIVAPFLTRPDVVVSTSPQMFCGLAGFVVSRIKRRPWVLEIRDLWPDSIVTVGAMKRGLAVKLLEKLETFAYRKADMIVIVSEAYRSHIAERCGDSSKIVLISNGADLERFDPEKDVGNIPSELNFSGKFVAAYIGTHGMAQGLETLFSAAESLRERRDIVFLLVGDGAERDKLLRLKDSLNLENIVMLGQRPKIDMPKIWAQASVSLIILRKKEIFLKVVPSKLFESMAMRVPVILGVEGESSRLLRQSAGGMSVEPENPAALAAAVASLADDEDRCVAMGLSGRRFIEDHFDRADLARKYTELLRSLVEGST